MTTNKTNEKNIYYKTGPHLDSRLIYNLTPVFESESPNIMLTINENESVVDSKSYIIDINKITKIHIYNTVTEIVKCVFQNLNTVTFEKNSKCNSIHQAAFQFSTMLQSISLPDSITYIGVDAFGQCDSLKEFTIPLNACVSNTALSPNNIFEKLTILQKDPSKISNYAFKYIASNKRNDGKMEIHAYYEVIEKLKIEGNIDIGHIQKIIFVPIYSFTDFTFLKDKKMQYVIKLKLITNTEQDSTVHIFSSDDIKPKYTINYDKPIYICDILTDSGITPQFNTTNGIQITDKLTFIEKDKTYHILYSKNEYVVYNEDGLINEDMQNKLKDLIIKNIVNRMSNNEYSMTSYPLNKETLDNNINFLSVYDPLLVNKEDSVCNILKTNWNNYKSFFNFGELNIRLLLEKNKSLIVRGLLDFVFLNNNAVNENEKSNYPLNILLNCDFNLIDSDTSKKESQPTILITK